MIVYMRHSAQPVLQGLMGRAISLLESHRAPANQESRVTGSRLTGVQLTVLNPGARHRSQQEW